MNALPRLASAIRPSFSRTRKRLKPLFPGVMLSITLGMAASFVSNAHGGPIILFALLLGMAFNFLAADGRFEPGLAFTSRSILRIGVALLGARITVEQVLALGWTTLAGVAMAVALTIGFGFVIAQVLGLKRRFGVLSAGAVAICGASAAAAISAVLPKYKMHERDTAFTIIGVTTLSTVAMVLYPILVSWLRLDPVQTGVFLGGTIHDVAQVVGAGYSVSPEAGDAATIVKLLRVALLLPTVLAISLLNRRASPEEDGGRASGLVPGFLMVFVAIVALNSLGTIPAQVQSALSEASQWCIVTAIAALGVKTSIAAMAKVGGRPIALIAAETAFIALLVLALVGLG
ncbi:putative sulfate exporter family transporter [Rhodospirillaceae bacterium SYSU D60014]|uniref:YeiH family protein n=1 Tax=Virgifigura deserti TaxID=2268457 RepID=UPI000E6603E5